MNNTASAHASAHVNVAIHAIQLAFSMTPRQKHEELLNRIYDEVVHRCFRTDLSQLRAHPAEDRHYDQSIQR
jgi:hypothetical protein